MHCHRLEACASRRDAVAANAAAVMSGLSGHGLEEGIDPLAFRGEEMVEGGCHDVFADALE